jgi:hypothetical protein
MSARAGAWRSHVDARIAASDDAIGDTDHCIPFHFFGLLVAPVGYSEIHLIHPATVVQNCNTRCNSVLLRSRLSFRKIIDPVNPLCCHSCTRSV